MKPFIHVLLIASSCVAQTTPPPKSNLATPTPKATRTVPKRTTRVIVVEPVIRVPLRYYGYSLLGNLIGSGIQAGLDSWQDRRNERTAAQELPEPYFPQYAEPPAITVISVESNPPGAAVFIDAKPFGPAPISVTVMPGSRFVAVRLDGFELWSKDIDTREGEPQKVSAQLKKTPEDVNVIVIKTAQ